MKVPTIATKVGKVFSVTKWAESRKNPIHNGIITWDKPLEVHVMWRGHQLVRIIASRICHVGQLHAF